MQTKLVQVRMKGDLIQTFESLKNKLKLENDSEVLRQAIRLTEKRMN